MIAESLREAGLSFAVANGYSGAASVPVDAIALPPDLIGFFGANGPSHFLEQHLVGYWPATLAAQMEAHIEDGNRSMRSWLSACCARRVTEPFPIGNANFRQDLVPA